MKKVYLFTPTEGRTEDINNYISAAANILRAMFENRGEEIEIVTNFNLEPAGTDADGERITKIRNCDNPLLYMSEEAALIDSCDYVARPDGRLGFAWSSLYDDCHYLIEDLHSINTIELDSDFLPNAPTIAGNRRRYTPVVFNRRDYSEMPSKTYWN